MKLAEKVYFNRVAVPTEAPRVVTGVHRIFVVDVSGSMGGSLPLMRRQLKDKLVSLMGENDTLTIIWFSGRFQCGIVCEAVPIAKLSDLQEVWNKIDQWIQPVGLTGFKEPLGLAAQVRERLLAKDPNAVFAFAFLSDGYDNQWSQREIMTAVKQLSFHNATVIEYGPWADRNLLSKMADAWGAEYVYAANFDAYEPRIEQILQRSVSGAPRKSVSLKTMPIGGIAFAIDPDEYALYTFAVDEQNSVAVPGHLGEVFYIAEQGPNKSLMDEAALYAAASVYALKMRPDVMQAVLGVLGDVYIWEQYDRCFGKDRYGEFQELCRLAVFDPASRWQKGHSNNLVPNDNVMTVLEILALLANDGGTKLLTSHPSFSYKRISRAAVNSAEVLTVADIKRLQDAMSELATTSDPAKLDALLMAVQEIKSSKVQVKFHPYTSWVGLPMLNLDYSKSRANITFGVSIPGYVDLTGLGLQNAPDNFDTSIYRSYAAVKDGQVNIETLPVRVSERVLDEIQVAIIEDRLPKNAVLLDPVDEDILLLRLSELPVINRGMQKAASAKELATLEFKLLQEQAAVKVYKHYLNTWFPVDKGATFAERYGEADAAILLAAGLTERGYAPKTVQAESVDVYLAQELNIKLAGYSSLPKVSDVEQVLDGKGKMTPARALLAPAIEVVRQFGDETTHGMEQYLRDMLEISSNEVKRLMGWIAVIKFSVLVGKVWFTEFADLSENEITVNVDGTEVKATFELKEIEVKI